MYIQESDVLQRFGVRSADTKFMHEAAEQLLACRRILEVPLSLFVSRNNPTRFAFSSSLGGVSFRMSTAIIWLTKREESVICLNIYKKVGRWIVSTTAQTC
jgi:hypothetical protein